MSLPIYIHSFLYINAQYVYDDFTCVQSLGTMSESQAVSAFSRYKHYLGKLKVYAEEEGPQVLNHKVLWN